MTEFYNYLNDNSKNYKILNGRESSYDLREEIQAWGGYWDERGGHWRVDNIEDSEIAYKALKASGLKLVAL